MAIRKRPTPPGPPNRSSWRPPIIRPAFASRPVMAVPPVPMQDELMTSDEAIALLEKHLQEKDSHTNNLWFVNTILYIILEGDRNCGRGVVCDPYAAFPVLGLCDMVSKQRLDTWSMLRPGRGPHMQAMRSGLQPPINNLYDIFEFSFDFRLSEKDDRFRLLRTVRITSYLLNADELPKHWGSQLWMNINSSPFFGGFNPGRVGTEVPQQSIVGDDMSSRMQSLIPVSHPVKFTDEKKLQAELIDRMIDGLLRLPEFETKATGKPFGIVGHMNWYMITGRQKVRLLRALPTILEVLWDEEASRDQVYYLIRIALKLNFERAMPSLYSKYEWKCFRDVITFLREHTPDDTLLTGNYKNYQDPYGIPFKPIPLMLLLWCLGCYDSARTRNKIAKEEITDLIQECIESSPIEKDLLKNLVFRSIFYDIDHSYVTDGAVSNDKNIDIENSPDKNHAIYEKLCEMDPALAGFVTVFGMPEEITLHAGWYQGFHRLRYVHRGPAFVSDQGELMRRHFRGILRDLFAMVEHFTVDTSGMHGGERKALAGSLIDTGSEEIVRTALEKNMTTQADLKRAMKTMVKLCSANPVIPYIIYICNTG